MIDSQTLLFISPEIILTILGLLILLLDLIFRERGHAALPWVAVFGFALSLAAILYIWGASRLVFADMYAIDTFALFFKLIAVISGIVITLVSIDYLRNRTPNKGDFFTLFVFSVLAMMFMASATNLLMIYLSIEFLSYTSYLLTGFLRNDKKSNEGAIKYFLFGAITSAVMLYGLSLMYGATGSLNLTEVASLFAATSDNSLRALGLVATALVLAGLGFKISLVPFHMWAPEAYEGAPTPVTAFLSVGPKAAGFALLLRLILTALPALQEALVPLLGVIAIATMTLGNLIAIQQTNVKRMLAYSSIAQAGYMLIGVVALNLTGNSPFSGLNGVLIYLFAYLFTNLGAFICVIAIEDATGITDIPQYAGLIKRAPYIAALFVFFFLSLAGIPPTAGFIGKFFVFASALREGFIFLAVVGVINSVVSVFYYFNIVRASFFQAPTDATPIRLSPVVTAALTVTAVVVLLIAVYPQPLFDVTSMSMAMLGVAGK
ncbi:MAG: NADH-quinone oxidoreductase subunit N [Chloroflexi bacterium]|nr:NADH-quinone oxidoreductase subunit N [Chloroflexota bacterium]